ncbi:signal peptidase II [Rubrobacter tropicus]|uniref:Lipoprotein signal peptidase n=1 Tax=Rubrobacter tropicus TaxID=2653851 RepID=A0A6G8QBS9_9ACTN|nr:signal peptidase II [Rubrobacter tropicus]
MKALVGVSKNSAAGRTRSLLPALATALLVFGADQGIKAIVENSMRVGESIPLVPGFLSLTHIKNDGGAFGILGGSQLLLLVGSAVAVVVVLWMLLSGPGSRATTYGCGLILGGAAGNLLDRLTAGEVTDYVHFSFWYIFNAADAAITVGVGLLLLSAFRSEPGRRPAD